MIELMDVSAILDEELSGLAAMFARRSWDGSVDPLAGIDETDDDDEEG